MGLITKIFGTYSERELKSIWPIVHKIEGMEAEYKAMTDAQLQAKTPEFKERLANGETLDDILPEAFATVREAADRVLGLRPYPVQLVGGIVLHQGRIAEMKTGEGKTLVATLPAYLNALTGKGVHIVTVNDYLAKRDLSSTTSPRSSGRRPTMPTSPTAPITRWALTICVTTWPSTPVSWCSGATTSPSWTRWTPS